MPRKKYYKKKDNYFNSPKPPKEGMVKYGKSWITEEEAEIYIGPEFYTDENEICKLTKKHSPYFCVFTIDPMNTDNDTYYISCIYVRRKNNKIEHRHTIEKPNMMTWIKSLQNVEKYDTITWKENYDNEQKIKTFLNQ